jgi:hypothetical protein
VQEGGIHIVRTIDRRRASIALAALLVAVAATLVVGRLAASSPKASPIAKYAVGGKELQTGAQGGSATDEAREAFKAQEQFDNSRIMPGDVVAAGAYSAAYGSLTSLPSAGGSWSELTKLPYDADDPDYRDYFSNSSGGSGLVTGRITGLAADNNGNVYAAGAVGGVWRSTQGGGNWTSIADSLPTLSSGDLELAPDGSLWYATGEANTGGTSYVGTGVYRLANPTTGSFSPSDRVGGNELESTTINSVRFANGQVWASTLRGIWSHTLGDYSAPWTLRFAPSPSYLPGGANAGAQNAAYMNIVNDLVIDPKNANHLLAAVGWRSGAAYNGFYESTDGGATWTRINPQGGLDATDVGYANFAYAADGSKLYVINQSPRKLNTNGMVNTYLDGVYVSNNGSLTGPWNKIASSDKLGSTSSGSALYANFGLGYSPGVQAWYNQFITVDPANANHVYVGLEEVYETKNGGTDWSTVGPYWNFYFGCWAPDALYPPDGDANRCPMTTHSDQHSVAIGTLNGKKVVYVGNDGGLYRRPVNGKENANHNATDWVNLNDGTIDALQYYYVGVGKLNADDAQRPDLTKGDSVLVSGGLQDNGGSLLRPGADKMVSNFGGDGGDVLVDPNDGCNIVQEYVYLSMSLTQTCANPGADHPNAFLDLSQSTTFKIGPPDINAQFIAPFTANATNVNQWLAGGNSLWYQSKGFAIRSGSEWQKVYTLAAPNQTFTAIAYSGNHALATWCGPCSNSTAALFKRGAVVGTFANGAWTWTPVDLTSTSVPNRFLLGTAIDPNNENHMFFAANGFSRRFSEGPGAGIGHVFESKDGGRTWSDISANFPDIPSSDILALKSGGLVVATDLGVLYRAPKATTWSRLGGGSLPLTVAMDLTLGPDGNVYVATHGRGIWRISAAGL